MLASYLPFFVFRLSRVSVLNFFSPRILFRFLGGMRCRNRFQLRVLHVCTSMGLIRTYADFRFHFFISCVADARLASAMNRCVRVPFFGVFYFFLGYDSTPE